ncbi:hypothetical protein CSOJ01_08521 [Colletotrichum sojae]|uniref:Rhodopsin domain-containing protein n=1 Tax=Colletotrichum sojae TaxID=2175907 RepID=A0A8H6J5V9_9PEZI|nr:hypothetical protein CSOJ01_08521 [Colletotrichum sojae]
MSSNAEPLDPAAQAAAEAAAAAALRMTIEAWTLYGIGMVVTFLRTYARAKAVGFRNFRADDYLAWAAALVYTIQSTLAYEVGNIAQGLANNGMTDEERAALSPSDPEYEMRIVGSKIQVAGWTTYSALVWLLKLSMLFFYIRLFEGLDRRYRMRIWIGFGLVLGTFLASMVAVFLSCIPFNKYWQISPDPGNSCQAAVSLPIIWTSFAANVSTDIYLIFIPLPLLWESTLRLVKKIASTIVLGAGIFVLVCATLKSIFVLVDPVNGAQLAGTWGTRETFVAVVTTNLPMIFPLIRTWLQPLWPSALSSSKKAYQTPSGFRTIGGGGGNGNSRSHDRRTGPPSANPITANMTFTESEERIMLDVKMQDMKNSTSPAPGSKPPNGIVVSNEIEVTMEDRTSQFGEQKPQRTHEW